MLVMEGAPLPKKARVKQEFDSRVISLPNNVQIPFDEQNDLGPSSETDCGDSSNEQFEPIEVPAESSEESFPLHLVDKKLKTETLKNSSTQIILFQPSESLEAVRNSWTHSMTYILIEEYRKLMSDFQDPHKKQKESWVKVAENMCRRGCEVTWDMCDQKWRNLKHTFKSIYFNMHRSELSKRRWDFYQVLEDVFGPQLQAENLKKSSDVSSKLVLEDVASKSEAVLSKNINLRVDPVGTPSPINYNSGAGAFISTERENTKEGKEDEDRKNKRDSAPPLWFQEFLKQYRKSENQRLALVREMHNDMLQIEKRKVAALEALLTKILER